MDENIKTLIGWWSLNGQRETNPFVKFFFFYMCFDAWITEESGEDIDSGKLRWLFNSSNCLKDSWSGLKTEKFNSWLSELKNHPPIEDTRPNHRNELICIDDISNFKQIVRFLYQVRCNLFHGHKSPMNRDDNSLVSLSSMILERWIINASINCHYV